MPFSSSAKEETYLVFLPNGRSLQTTRKLHELIRHLDGSRRVEEIASILSGIWGCCVRPEDVGRWIDRYIVPNDLLAPDDDQPPNVLAYPAKAPSTKGVMLIPGDFALLLTRPLRVLFHPSLSLPLLWAAVICHGLIGLDLQSGAPGQPFSSIPASAYLTGYLFALLSVLFHEFGHLSACRYFDCPHGEIRLGLYLIFPVLYANVSPAWRLDRKKRVVVDLAGMYFQLILTIPAFLLFKLSHDPLWLLLFLEFDAMILLCLNPFLRFDGYWLCSDLLGVPNLRSRSQAMMKTLFHRFIGRCPAPRIPLLDIRPGARIGLALYGIGSYLFAGLCFVFLFQILPRRLQMFPSEAGRLLQDCLREGSHGHGAEMFVRLGQFFLSCLMLLATGRMLARGIPSALNAGRYLLRRIRGSSSSLSTISTFLGRCCKKLRSGEKPLGFRSSKHGRTQGAPSFPPRRRGSGVR